MHLNHTLVARSESPANWLYVLHGVFGRGRNWASVARALVEARPEWGAVLVDLRLHGESVGFDPPHTLEATAQDVRALSETIGRPIDAVMGHSFGGKPALMLARDRAARQAWMIDSTPDAREPAGSAWDMIEAVRSLPSSFASRGDAIAGLESRGVAPGVAAWMATNVALVDGSYRWRLDFDALELLLRDFFRTDLWSVIEQDASADGGPTVHIVKAEASSLLGEDACQRIERAAARGVRVWLHRVSGGHWVNAENPDAVIQLLRLHL